MKKRIWYWVLMVVMTLLFAAPQIMAEEKGKKVGTEAPPGWEKGEKKGWEGDTPPKSDKKAMEAMSEKSKEKAEELDQETEEKAEESK